MTNSEIYSGLYLAKNKIQDILYLELCSRVGAPGTDAAFFSEYKMTPDELAKLNRVYYYIKTQLTQQFLESISAR